jgi:type IV pilus assembly protein PilA
MTATKKHILLRWLLKQSEKGFTLVELLVVIVIIGILTAIAIPSFLNQTAKAKHTEAKQNIGAVIKGQQLWYSENSNFTTKLDDLALGNALQGVGGSTSTTRYNYQMTTSSGASTRFMAIVASSIDVSLRSYTGALSVERADSQESVWNSILCTATTAGSTSAVPTDSSSCPTGFRQVTPNEPS